MQATEHRKPAMPGSFMPPSGRIANTIQRSPDSRFGEDFSAIPATSHHRSVVTPRHDEQSIRIDAVPDVLLAGFAPVTVNVDVSDSSVSTIEWHLVAPAGNVVPGTRIESKRGDADAKSKPFTLQRSHLDDAGKYRLQCSGLDDSGIARVYAVRDFNVVTAPMSTGVWRHGRFGAIAFRDYSAVTPSDGSRPWVRLNLAFLPSEEVACDEVLFVQAVQVLSPDGRRLHDTVSQELAARASSDGWSIDQDENVTSPYYIVQRDVRGNEAPRKEMGSVGRGGSVPREASMLDTPNTSQSMVTHFESCAVCRSGSNKGQVYGCATWGFSYVGGKMTLMPRGFADEPSEEFRGAASGWNRRMAEKRAEGSVK
jgi:hypothetical protein